MLILHFGGFVFASVVLWFCDSVSGIKRIVLLGSLLVIITFGIFIFLALFIIVVYE